MTPIDPVEASRVDPRNSMEPPYVDDDPNEEMVEEGMEVAEDETRQAVADVYEASAKLSDDPSESLDDIDYEFTDGTVIPPELAAIHEEYIPQGERKVQD